MKKMNEVKKKRNIVLMICWQGNYPWYFLYFLHSCRYNLSVDFLIFTDIEDTIINLPPNVNIVPYSIERFKTDAAIALNFDVVSESGYKFCDFKPAYGLIFSDWIKNYDFWGYCDIDVIFGNIRTFITDKLLSEYDVISARHDYLTGCFALYRNNQRMRELFYELPFNSCTRTYFLCFALTNFSIFLREISTSLFDNSCSNTSYFVI